MIVISFISGKFYVDHYDLLVASVILIDFKSVFYVY